MLPPVASSDLERLRDAADDHLRAGRFAQAIEAYRKLAHRLPRDAEVQNNLGLAYASVGDQERAAESYRRSAKLLPDNPHIHHNLGTTYDRLGRPAEAIASYDRAIALQPDFPLAHYYRGMLLLLMGDFERGWADFEWRLQKPGSGPHRRILPQPRWNGSDISGKTILLHAEQGLGDTMHFARYATLVAARGARVIVESQPSIATLLRTVKGVAEVVTGPAPLLPHQLPPFDVHCPLLSLPFVFGTNLGSIPAEIPYLFPDPARAESWRQQLAADRNLRIGLSWAGSPLHGNDRSRSMALAAFAPLASVPNVTFYTLQKGPAAAQAPPAGLKLVNCSRDMDETAAIMANLDLVLAVDTSLAHLAGALGRPVWILLSSVPDWRWMLSREDTSWYPRARLFRQSTPGDWMGVIDRVRNELMRLSAARSAADER
jgi:hypothetical protein